VTKCALTYAAEAAHPVYTGGHQNTL